MSEVDDIQDMTDIQEMEEDSEEIKAENRDENNKANQIASENDLESDSSDGEEDECNELPYQTKELPLDSLYYKDRLGNRIPSPPSHLIGKRFHERILKFMIQRRHEQPTSIPTPYSIGVSPAPKTSTLKSKKTQKPDPKAEEPSPKKARRYNSAMHQRLEMERKKKHPSALHEDVFFNEPNQQNDGPFCKCYTDCRNEGVIHNCYPGEASIPFCDMFSNNSTRLKHYIIEVKPDFPIKNRQKTTINFQGNSFVFTGFSLFFHKEVTSNLPIKWLNRMFPEYSVRLFPAPSVEGFCVYELELFYQYFFGHLLELHDVSRGNESKSSCPFFHVMPRFVQIEEVNGILTHTLLPMVQVLDHLTTNFNTLSSNPKGSVSKARRWLKNQLVLCPTKKPACIRVDELKDCGRQGLKVVHFAQKPSSHSSFAKSQFFQAQRHYRTLTARLRMEKSLSDENSKQLTDAFDEMQKYKGETYQRKEREIEIPMRNFHSTGIYADMAQHAMFLLTVCWRVRYHWSLDEFESILGYKFENRLLLELALTHPSNLTNYGTNSDHARNTLRNCGLRDIRNKQKARKTHDFVRRKGITTLMKIMAKFGSKEERQSTLHHNERLEFLGDAIVELLTSHHLFYMMPYAEEGVLASHRSKLVRNMNLGQVGRRLQIHKFLLHLHGPDLSNYDGMNKAMANAFEALIASVYLDSSIDECDRVLAQAFFGEVPDLFEKWSKLKEHPLKLNSPSDRHWIERVKWLQRLNDLEKYTGIFFHHIRVLARAFTRRQVGYNNLTQGHNQRLEFLGDTVLQFFVSDYLYRHFPRHQEGHLSLLRSCLVSNKTQSVICDDLRLTDYLINPKNSKNPSLSAASNELTLKDKADLVEAYLGAIYVDRGFDFCEIFCQVCFFPRLHTFIRTSRWNDPKSQLQQCCLTLRRPDTVAPDIPEYRTVGKQGPTNTREYRVIVFFRNKRLASGVGHSIHEGELNAAENALIRNAHLFGNFNLEDTYLGSRIKEYDEWADEKSDNSDNQDKPYRYSKVAKRETEDDTNDKPGPSTELEPIKISSDEDSDISD